MADLAATLDLPVILVVGMRLGCINHALLSAEAIGPRLCGWVANLPQPAMAALAGNLQSLRSRMPTPCLGVVHHGEAAEAALDPAFFP
jgi:dethiobiotin synthetase